MLPVRHFSQTGNENHVHAYLVLLEPAGQVVGDAGSVVDNSKVSIGIRLGVGLLEVGALAEQVLVKLGSKSLKSLKQNEVSQKSKIHLNYGHQLLIWFKLAYCKALH